MATSVLAIVICYWIARAERKVYFKEPLNKFFAFINAILLAFIATTISFLIVYVVIVEYIIEAHGDYRNIIGEIMFSVVLSGLISFSLLRSDINMKNNSVKNIKLTDDNPWANKNRE